MEMYVEEGDASDENVTSEVYILVVKVTEGGTSRNFHINLILIEPNTFWLTRIQYRKTGKNIAKGQIQRHVNPLEKTVDESAPVIEPFLQPQHTDILFMSPCASLVH